MRYVLLICCAGVMLGQGTDPKPKPEDYEVHAQARDAAVGAEYMVHSYSLGEQTFIAKDYLVVEVALYPPKGATITVNDADFSLRINGGKQVLQPEQPAMVVAREHHPEWQQPTGLQHQVGVGAGNVEVIEGGPAQNPNPFPNSRPPAIPPPVMKPSDDTGLHKPPVNPDVVLQQTALLEGPRHTPVSGFLYFPYRGKTSSIKSLELVYEDAELKLR
jgi:hypothetical protein